MYCFLFSSACTPTVRRYWMILTKEIKSIQTYRVMPYDTKENRLLIEIYGRSYDIMPTNETDNVNLALSRHQPELLGVIQNLLPSGGIFPFLTTCNLTAPLRNSSFNPAKKYLKKIGPLALSQISTPARTSLRQAALTSGLTPGSHRPLLLPPDRQPSPLRSSQEYRQDCGFVIHLSTPSYSWIEHISFLQCWEKPALTYSAVRSAVPPQTPRVPVPPHDEFTTVSRQHTTL